VACESKDVTLARDAFKHNKFELAYGLYQKVLDRTQSADLLLEFGLISFKLQKYKEAKQAFQAVLEQQPDSVEAYIGLGKTCQMRTEWAEAENAFKNAIANDPSKYPEAYSSLGELYEFHDRLEEAEKAYRQAIELDPKHAKAYRGLGTVAMKQTRYTEAISWYEKYKALTEKTPPVGNP